MSAGLARQILARRVDNEIRALNEYLGMSIPPAPEGAQFPMEIRITLSNVPARISRDESGDRHEFALSISGEYPYERPSARWLTPIFHPNIASPRDGGFVCAKMLESWSFGSTLLSFVKGVEQLLADPNPDNPYGTESCMEAARWHAANRPRFEASVSYGGRDV
ncbi:MAG: ubiquitin-conjugating enzyme E2 [Candidatus Methanoplasma sp.]|jgi:ubiquitin-protein ligase|nr:ubiquitin-conjugating enzyme E2 [Candidatus Methanoplasma sp.]